MLLKDTGDQFLRWSCAEAEKVRTRWKPNLPGMVTNNQAHMRLERGLNCGRQGEMLVYKPLRLQENRGY